MDKKKSQQDFPKPLAKLLINVYSIPKWDKNN